jgi:hypothetical protein
VRTFLGTLTCIHEDFALHATPLVNLTRKGVDFVFSSAEKYSMEILKKILIASPAIHIIDYASGRRVILSVDSSYIVAGMILLQIGEDGKEYPSRLGSITWNEREARYSQAKIELYGLFRALRAYRLYLVRVTDLLIRMDAKYIKGMLNNPDIPLNTAMNRWIVRVLLFDFAIEHTPGISHAPDGLSRRPGAPEDPVDNEDVEDWIDKACGFAVLAMNWARRKIAPARNSIYLQTHNPYMREQGDEVDKMVFMLLNMTNPTLDGKIPRTKRALKWTRR